MRFILTGSPRLSNKRPRRESDTSASCFGKRVTKAPSRSRFVTAFVTDAVVDSSLRWSADCNDRCVRSLWTPHLFCGRNFLWTFHLFRRRPTFFFRIPCHSRAWQPCNYTSLRVIISNSTRRSQLPLLRSALNLSSAFARDTYIHVSDSLT